MNQESLKFEVVREGENLHTEALRFCQSQYSRHFGSTVTPHFPQVLVALSSGAIVGCVGFRAAATSPLFLEQYLDSTVEIALARADMPVARDGIVEIGGFAARDRHVVLPLMMELAPRLAATGFETAICTVTGKIQAFLGYLQLSIASLGTADAGRVSNPEEWGSYYDLSPQILAGNIHEGIAGIDRVRACVARTERRRCAA